MLPCFFFKYTMNGMLPCSFSSSLLYPACDAIPTGCHTVPYLLDPTSLCLDMRSFSRRAPNQTLLRHRLQGISIWNSAISTVSSLNHSLLESVERHNGQNHDTRLGLGHLCHTAGHILQFLSDHQHPHRACKQLSVPEEHGMP